MRKQNTGSHKNIYLFLLTASMFLSVMLSALFYYGPSPLNGSDNYLYTQLAYSLESHGIHSLINSGPLSVKYILVGGIALFYKLFGFSRLSSVAFDITCVLLTMGVLYLIGTELYDKRAGLIAAFLYGISPVVVIEASNVGDDVPMALFVSLSVLFLLLAFRKDKREKTYYALSAFTALMGFLIVAEAIIICVFLFIALAIYWMRTKRPVKKWAIPFIAGMLIALILMAILGYVQAGSFTYIYTVDSSWYYLGSCPTCSISMSTYISTLLPFSVIQTVATYASRSLSNTFSLLAIPSANTGHYSVRGEYYFGYYMYVAIMLSIYLAFRDKRALYIPWLWIGTSLLYLAYGSMSPFAYKPISIAYFERALLLLWPAVAILLGVGISSFVSDPNKPTSAAVRAGYIVYLKYAVAFLLLAFLTWQSIYSIRYVNYSIEKYTYPLIEAGRFINTLPSGVAVMHPTNIPIAAYTNENYSFYILGYPITCVELPKSGYLVMELNSTLQNECNLSIAFSPHPPPPRFDKYTVFDNYGFGDFSNVGVYLIPSNP